MRKLTLSLAFAASAIAMAAMQANGSNTSVPKAVTPRDLQACKFLVRKMERSAAENTWRNRVRTWKCRDDLSPDTAETEALGMELDDERR